MNFDDILRQIGEFGRYQKCLYAFVVFPVIFNAMQTFNVLFILGDQNYRCNIREWTLYNTNDSLIRVDLSESLENITTTTQCDIQTYVNMTNQTRTTKCMHWQYDTSLYSSTVVSDFDLVCDNVLLRSHVSMAFFGGFLTSAIVMGTLGDIFGRMPVACFCNLLTFAASMALPWSHSIEIFAILRYLTGVGSFGYFCQAMIIGLELVGPSYRVYTGIIIELVYCVGELILCGMAYFIRDWKTLQIAISAPSAILLVYWFFLPESTRWLLAKGRPSDAMKTIQKIAAVNRSKYDTNIQLSEEKDVNFKDAAYPIIKSRALMIRWLILLCSWFTVAFTYYGISYNVGRIGGSVYVNFLISIIVEFIGYSSVILLATYFGRKVVHCGSFVVAGVACIGTIFSVLYANKSLNWITIALSMVGKCFISAAFGNIFIYTTELFPTNVRSFILGTTNIGARLGTLVAPYVADITYLITTTFGQALPLIIFGCISVMVGIISLSIPETLNATLPERIEEAIAMKGKPKKSKEENGGLISISMTKL